MPNAVYDPDTEDEQRYHPPNLDPHDNKPVGDSSDPRASLNDAEQTGDNLYNPSGDTGTGTSGTGRLLDRERGSTGTTGNGSGNFNFTDSDKGSRASQVMKAAAKHKKEIGIGAGVGGGLAGIVLMIFFMLIPLKIEHVVTNLEKRFFATSEDAVEKQTSILLRGYLVRALPSYKTCGSTISKNCRVKISGNGPVNNLYRTWANARLENKLAKNYGIEFKYNKSSKNWYLKAPGTNPEGDNIGPDGRGLNSDFERADRATMRRAVNDAMEHETRWKKIMYRYKVGRLLEEKYGIKRCVVFCGTRDKAADKIDLQKKAATLKLVQRVLTPRTETLGIAIECMITNCKATDSKPTQAEDGTTGSLNGSPESETDTKAREVNQRLSTGYAAESLEKINADTEELEKKGVSKVITERFLGKILPKVLAERAANAIPIVGTVIFASQIIDFVHNSGPALEKLAYMVNSGAYAQTWQMYNTYASEVHTGEDTATEVGSFTNALGPGDRGTKANPQVGGTGGAESSLLYQNIIDNKSPNRFASAALNGILPAKALAASSSSSSDKPCEGNTAVPAGMLVCPVVYLGKNTIPGVVSAPSKFLDLPVVGQVSYIAGGISGIVNDIAGVFGSIITSIPGVGAAVQTTSELASKVVQPFFQQALNLLINNPFGLHMSGSRLFDILAGGANVAGNLFAQVGIGGKALTDQEFATIVNQRESEAQQKFASQSVFARTFDTSSEYSLVTKLAMTVPFGLQADAQTGVASLLNPLGALSKGFGSLLSGRVSAAITAQPNAFGTTPYGWTEEDFKKLESDIAAVGGVPEYWDKYCSDNASYAYLKDNSWNEEAANTLDPNTSTPRNDTTNPCLLIKVGLGVGGGIFDTSNLTKDDLADAIGNSASGTVTSVSSVPNDPQQLAKAIVDSGKLSDEDGRYMAQIKAISNGNFSCNVNPYILQMLYGVVVQDGHRVVMSSLNRKCTGVLTESGVTSYHYREGGGHAIDVVSFDGGKVNGAHNSPTLNYLNEAVKYLPKGVGFGQVNSCGSGFHIPEGDYDVPDTCNHQHIQVPVKNING